MAFTSAGLLNNGRTPHYQISYDTALSTADGVTRASGLMAACEMDFALMSSWFTGVNFVFSFPISVKIANASGGASWQDPPDILLLSIGFSPTVTINPGTGTSVEVVRYLLVTEVTEMFMASMEYMTAGFKNVNPWFEPTSVFSGADEGSKGEALSRFLGVQFRIAIGSPPIPFPGFGVVPFWLNSSRPNFVDMNPDDNSPDATTGCTTCFLYFLHYQLGFSINQIIQAGAATLAGVFMNLTGTAGAWPTFSTLVNLHYPQGTTFNPAGDNIFPVSNLTQFLPPNQIISGESQSTQVMIDNPAMAGVIVQLSSDNPAVVQVPPTVTVPVGATSAAVTLQAIPQPGAFAPISVPVHATYAGKTLTVVAQVVPPSLVSLTLAPLSVVCGNDSTATVSLNAPASSGPVTVNLTSYAPTFAAVPTQVVIPEGQTSAQFTVTTPVIEVTFKPVAAIILATFGASSVSASLTVNPSVIAGILNSLRLFPTSVPAGQPSRGTVTLVGPVPTPTIVYLVAFDPSAGPGGHLPSPDNPSTLASVPPSVTIPAGQTAGQFTISTKGKGMVAIMAGAVDTRYAVLTIL